MLLTNSDETEYTWVCRICLNRL